MGSHTLQSKGAIALIIVSAALAMFMSALDGTIVNIALPTISSDFGLTTSTVSWVSTIYLLVSAGSFFLMGKLINVAGYKKIFILGFLLFTLGSFACGFLPVVLGSFPLLLVSRVFQALGGSIMIVIAPAIISNYLPEEKQAKGLAIVMMLASLATALGPTIGGLVTEYLNWSWIFFINVPVGIFAVILGFLVFPRESDEKKATMKGFDGVGAGLIFVGLAALLFLFSEGASLGWASLPVILSMVLTVVGIGGFIIREHKARDPVLDLRFFRNPSFVLIVVIIAMLFGIFAGANYLLPFYLQLIQGLSAFNAGLILTALSIGLMIAGFIAGQVYMKLIGKLKYLLMGGTLLVAAGFFLLSRLHPWSGLGIVIAGLVLIGLGLGFTTVPITTMILKSAPQEKAGMASSISSLMRFAPMTIGIAVFNIILIAGVKYLAGINGIVSKPPADIAANLLTTGFDLCFFIGMLLAVAVFILCFFVSEKTLAKVKETVGEKAQGSELVQESE
ncbi:MAG TPA: DHA2 family efflux MFS transporter permease subunit [Methanocorpusculum sp.]|nr:DHA2 family efflux MFS transporter permease subunit [Methanocorpusculum sp.]